MVKPAYDKLLVLALATPVLVLTVFLARAPSKGSGGGVPAQFWAERDFPADYGDGEAVDCLSVDVSDWDTPGPLTGKTAKRCTRSARPTA